jgi:DNA repair exonuclease SbcCD ATPase subunit
MSNIDKRAFAMTKELATLMVERFSMNPVSSKLLNEAWQKEFPDEVAIAKRMLALLDELEAKDKSISFLKDQLAQLANFNPDWDKLEAATDSLREHMAELTAARKRIAELEATQGKPVMFIDGDISPADAEKLAAVIREFNEETETPAARMARIIRENPHPTNMCDMPVAAAGKGEAS